MGSLELSDTYLSFLPLWQAFFEAQTLSAMGLLKVGTPLHWKDSLEHCNYVREHGILQFIATYRRRSTWRMTASSMVMRSNIPCSRCGWSSRSVENAAYVRAGTDNCAE